MPAAVSLSQMVDLSLGTPEIGSVNFNVMHTLLHAIIKKLNIGDHKAEINETDRDFLSTSKFRARSMLSDADSGRGEDSEDATSEKSSVGPFRPSPYHAMELKVEKLMQQMEELNNLPSNSELFNRMTQSKGDSTAERPVADMWQYMQLKKRVDANEEGVGKLFSLLEDMMKEMQQLKDANKRLEDKIRGLNLDDLKKRLADLEKVTKDLQQKFDTLPTPDEWSQFVTWPALEDALRGIRDSLQPAERIVIEMSSQTEPNKRSFASRPGSSRPISRMSTPGPSEQVLDLLERLGRLDTDHQELKARVDAIEEELKNKLDKSALEGLGVPAELLEQIGKLKEELDALAAARNKSTSNRDTNTASSSAIVPSINNVSSDKRSSDLSGCHGNNPNTVANSNSIYNDAGNGNNTNVAYNSSLGSHGNQVRVRGHDIVNGAVDLGLRSSDQKSSKNGSVVILKSIVSVFMKARKSKPSLDSVTETDSSMESSSEEVLSIMYEESALKDRVAKIEERLRAMQELLLDDSAYHSDVSELTDWLTHVEKKIASTANVLGAENKVASTANVLSAENKIASTANVLSAATDEAKSVKTGKEEKEVKKDKSKKEPKKSEVVEERLEEEEEIKHGLEEILETPDISDVPSTTLIAAPELHATNERVKKLAYNLNDQLHSLRDKVFIVDNELKRMAKGVEFALLRTKVAGINEMDSDALTRAQQAILQLQAEVEKLHHTTSDIIDENKTRTQQIEDILRYCDKLQQVKADKDYVQMEVDVKADKKSLESKVNHKLFDQTTDEINKMIKEILDKLAGHDEDWKTAYSKLTEDIDGKLDRLELDPLKEWLEARLKALNDKLKKYQKMDWGDDDAAGIRKQLIQKFHCISCDRPIDMMPTGPIPSLPSQQGLNPTRSPRPYTTFELDQIRQHAKSGLNIGKNTMNFERALAEKQLAQLKKSDLRAFLVHFKHDFDNLTNFSQTLHTHSFANPEVTDYYATPRPCGGSHTLTYPHKRNSKLTHLSHLFREEEPVAYATPPKEETDVQGVDGHIYRGRTHQQKLDARLPTSLASNNNNNNQMSVNVSIRTRSPQPPRNAKTSHGHRGDVVINQSRPRPVSAKTPPSPRPSSASVGHHAGSRPQSARLGAGQQEPAPAEEPVQVGTGQLEDEPITDQNIQLEVPVEGTD